MTCYKPIVAKYVGRVPCGQCVGCRLDKSYEWAVRCMDEVTHYNASDCHFVTFTYAPEHLPEPPSLSYKVHADLLKRIRKRFGGDIRYFLGAEYGSEAHTFRPHYHYIFFGLSLDDLKLYKRTRNGPLYNSEKLSKCWKYGHVVIAEVNYETCAYVARYSMKKITGKKSADYYGVLKPEFSHSSKSPAIGLRWLVANADLLLERGYKLSNGVRRGIPRYYKKWLEKHRPVEYSLMKEKNLDDYVFSPQYYDSRQDRLAVKHKIKNAQLRSLKRDNDDEF